MLIPYENNSTSIMSKSPTLFFSSYSSLLPSTSVSPLLSRIYSSSPPSFFSFSPPLSLTYSAPHGMIKCQNTHTHCRAEKETNAMRRWTQCPVNVLGLEVHKQLDLRVNMLSRVTSRTLEKLVFASILTHTYSSTHTHIHKQEEARGLTCFW